MTYEAIALVQTSIPIDMTCADGTGIEKGTLLSLADLNTVAAHASADQIFGGIAAKQKIADDGKTTISVYRDGIFKVKCSGIIVVGQPVALSAFPNAVAAAPALKVSGGQTIGIAMETGANTETIRVELRIGASTGVA